ncbi:MAG: hypothetical protein ACKVJP_08240 [Flavobacteriales bacterium]|tara:strand:- start:3981 stop:4106 length:126 start_codon:yes stop_codon:yes gene_type:complete
MLGIEVGYPWIKVEVLKSFALVVRVKNKTTFEVQKAHGIPM